MHSGKQLRINRFFFSGIQRGLIVPIDHGLTVGPLNGIQSAQRIARWVCDSNITGVIAHKGMIERLTRLGSLGRTGVMLHVNGMSALSEDADTKEMLASVRHAVELGADGISLQVNFDGRNDSHNLRMLGSVTDAASRFGLPVLTMLYDKVIDSRDKSIERLRHLMRITIELGADFLKLEAPKDLSDIPEILEDLSNDIHIFFAGGALRTDDSLEKLAQIAVASGARGLCVGRNIFQRNTVSTALGILRRTIEEPKTEFKLVEHGLH